MPAERDVSVVICAYSEERWGDLVAAVASAFDQAVPPREVVVAVDHNDKLLERARRDLPGAIVVANEQQPGLAGARNSGALATSAAIVAFLDDDARAERDWIAQLAAPYERASVLGVGGRIEPDWRAPRPRWFPDEFKWAIGCSYRGLPAKPAPVRNMIGANMSVRREVFDAINGFREDLGRLEETDFCIRGQVRFPDGTWLYWPDAVVRHAVIAQRTTWAFFRARCFNEGVAKASMVDGTGHDAGLQSERRYARIVLPSGVAIGLLRGLRGDRDGPRQAAAIIGGLAFTVAGYARGRLALVRTRRSGPPVGIPRRGNTP